MKVETVSHFLFQTLELAFGTAEKPVWAFYLYNIVQTIFMLGAALLNLFPSTLLAIDGAVCGFGLLYVIPICLHFRACFGTSEEDKESGSLVYGIIFVFGFALMVLQLYQTFA